MPANCPTPPIPLRLFPAGGSALPRLALALLLAVPLLHAQPARPLPPPSALKKLTLEQLLNIEVTSVSKRPEPLARTASAIQVITADDIRSSGATRLPEALRLASNLEVAQIDARQWAITARGFNNSTANKMLVLMDGRMLYTPLYAGVFWDVQDTLLEDLERIEVISGPGATQWGSNAVNGVINIISKSARDTQGGLLLAGAGTELQGFGAARYGGQAAPGVYYRVYGKYASRDESVLADGRPADDAWDLRQAGFRVDWERGQGQTVTIQGDGYGGDSGQPTAGDISVGGGNLLARWSRVVDARDSTTLQLYYDRTHRRVPGAATADVDIYDLDFQHRAPLGLAHDLTWGVGYRLIADDITNASSLAFWPSRTTRQWFTGFVQDEISLMPDRVQLTVGAKYEHNEYSGHEIQPSVRVTWQQPAHHQTLWGAVSRAMRAPSRIDRELYAPAAPPYTIAGGADFQSEELFAYELGYRVQPTPRTAFALSAFYHDYDDLRSLEPVSPPATTPVVIANGMEGYSVGVEATAQFRLTKAWRLSFGWTELRVHSEPKPGSLDFTSVRSQSADPNHMGQIRSSHELPGGFEIDLTGRYVSRVSNQDVPPYAELDVRLGWEVHPGLELSLVGQNLLDRRHAEFGTPLTRREVERSVYGKVAWRF